METSKVSRKKKQFEQMFNVDVLHFDFVNDFYYDFDDDDDNDLEIYDDNHHDVHDDDHLHDESDLVIDHVVYIITQWGLGFSSRIDR